MVPFFVAGNIAANRYVRGMQNITESTNLLFAVLPRAPWMLRIDLQGRIPVSEACKKHRMLIFFDNQVMAPRDIKSLVLEDIRVF